MKYVKVLLITLTAIGFICWHISGRVTRFDLPDGELKWSPVKPTNAKMCLPAAFTNENGEISGAYRYDGRTYQNGKALKILQKIGKTVNIEKKGVWAVIQQVIDKI